MAWVGRVRVKVDDESAGFVGHGCWSCLCGGCCYRLVVAGCSCSAVAAAAAAGSVALVGSFQRKMIESRK